MRNSLRITRSSPLELNDSLRRQVLLRCIEGCGSTKAGPDPGQTNFLTAVRHIEQKRKRGKKLTPLSSLTYLNTIYATGSRVFALR